jgi:hypothetical protein
MFTFPRNIVRKPHLRVEQPEKKILRLKSALNTEQVNLNGETEFAKINQCI